MPWKKQKTKYKRKRKNIFTGIGRRETERQSEENVVLNVLTVEQKIHLIQVIYRKRNTQR